MRRQTSVSFLPLPLVSFGGCVCPLAGDSGEKPFLAHDQKSEKKHWTRRMNEENFRCQVVNRTIKSVSCRQKSENRRDCNGRRVVLSDWLLSTNAYLAKTASQSEMSKMSIVMAVFVVTLWPLDLTRMLSSLLVLSYCLLVFSPIQPWVFSMCAIPPNLKNDRTNPRPEISRHIFGNAWLLLLGARYFSSFEIKSFLGISTGFQKQVVW